MTREELTAQRILVVAQLEVANATLLARLGQPYDKARLDTGEGSQMFERVPMSQLSKIVKELRDELTAIDNALGTGFGIMAIR